PRGGGGVDRAPRTRGRREGTIEREYEPGAIERSIERRLAHAISAADRTLGNHRRCSLPKPA
ncbi:MAG TPA: hypothetical protein VM347_22165, partial [Nonomuraea sp.]|nr:hypothetical protein [Nonomuraea sp.]